MCIKDQVWFSLLQLTDFRFGVIYISPLDSPFYSSKSFCSIQEQWTKLYSKVLIMGDLNAQVPCVFAKIRAVIHTKPRLDRNYNGRDLHCLCDNTDLLFVKYMHVNDKHMDGGLTFRKDPREVSQLDCALCTFPVIQHINYFTIHNELDLCTDHHVISSSLSRFDSSVDIIYIPASTHPWRCTT